MNFFAILVVVGFVIWAILLLDTLVSARGDVNDVATRCLIREVHLDDNTGVSSIQGRRMHMEDTYQVLTHLSEEVNIHSPTAIFAVFDGHGGKRASEYCADHLHKLLAESLLHEQKTQTHNLEIVPLRALQSAFRQLDRDWLDIARTQHFEDGSTAICALIYRGILYVANVGDSRAVLCTSAPPVSTTTSANGTPGTSTPLYLYSPHSHNLPMNTQVNTLGKNPIPTSFNVAPTHSNLVRSIEMSSDHKPTRDDERKRIEALGGRIVFHGTWRVEGVLALTRAIGDRRLKTYVSGEPEVRRRRLLPGDSALVIASDGLWDVISSNEVCSIINSARSPQEAADFLTRTAFNRGSSDNITTMVINLRPYVGTGMNQTFTQPTLLTTNNPDAGISSISTLQQNTTTNPNLQLNSLPNIPVSSLSISEDDKAEINAQKEDNTEANESKDDEIDKEEEIEAARRRNINVSPLKSEL